MVRDYANNVVPSQPLIYFSSFDCPDNDIELRKKMAVDSSIHLKFGGNYIDNKKILIIKGEKDNCNSYTAIKQLFLFVVKNSKHGASKWEPLEKNICNLFYTSEPLILTCGKISNFFKKLIITYMNFSPEHARRITLHTDESLQETAVGKNYLAGGHAILELFFPELNKWVIFDLDMGIIPIAAAVPLSMIEISRLDSAKFDFNPVGLDKYGKGLKSKEGKNISYRNAKDIFGILYNEKWYFLFLKQKQFAKRFKQNFELVYNVEAIIYTDPLKFSQQFY